MMKSRLYYPKTLGDAPQFIFEGVAADSDLTFRPDFTMQPRSFIRKVLKFLFVGRIPLSGRMVELITGYKGYAWLPTLQPGDRLLVNGVTNLHTLKAIAWLVPDGVRKFNYFNNCLRFYFPESTVGRRVQRMQQMGYRLMTFDPDEAQRYGMTYTEQFYRYPDKTETTIKYDFFFCGERKDRLERLNRLREQLEGMGYRCLFIIVPPADKISYLQYLEHVRESRCIVDLMQESQAGLTRRPIEALFFGKKLLTENTFVSTYDFYRPENVFILHKDPMDSLSRFMEQPLVADEALDEAKRHYDVNHWLEYFK